MPPEKKNNDAEVQACLRTIYQEPGGALPDLSRLEKSRSRRWLGWMCGAAGFFLVLSGAAWSGFVWLGSFRASSVKALALDIRGPQQVTLGQPQEFVVHWSNQEWQSLTDAHIRLNLPADFSLTSSDPPLSTPASDDWSLGFIPSRGSGEIRVTGVFQGALGTKTSLQALGRYHLNGARLESAALVDYPLTYAESVLDGRFVMPAQAVAGEVFSFHYRLANHGSQAQAPVHVRFEFPPGFIQSSSTNADASAVTAFEVNLGELAPQAVQDIEFSGLFTAGNFGAQTFVAIAGLVVPGHGLAGSARAEAGVSVLDGNLGLRFSVNGSSAQTALHAGDALHVRLGYQNTSARPLSHVTLLFGMESLIDGQPAQVVLTDAAQADDQKHGLVSVRGSTQTIRYDETRLPELARLDAQAEGALELSIPTVPAPSSSHDAFIRLTFQGAMDGIGAVTTTRIVRAEPVMAAYESTAEIKAEARYFSDEGAPYGAGPLPPRVGTSTVYRVFWQAHKTLHALRNVSIRAVLPSAVAWAGSSLSDQGALSYDTSTRSIVWQVADVPAGDQTFQASFLVKLTPQAWDRGRFAALLATTSLTAEDGTGGRVLQAQASGVSTDMPNDDLAQGQGVVR